MGEPDHTAKTFLGFEYFIKDWTSTSRSASFDNVRAVITSEDALYTDKFLATMEDVHAVIEEENFDNINETREDLPTAYPVDGSVYLNERIASLSAANGTEIGPSLVMPVKRGDKVSLSTSYFYEEDAPGTTYQNMDFFLNEILISLAASGSSVLNLGESQLLNMASGGDQNLNNSILSLLSNEFDTTDVDKPHAYLVWMMYDQNMKLDVAHSGAAQVENPNALETIIRNDLDVGQDGYLHAYVSNGSDAAVNFDNFLVQYQRGKLRQINDYYPYGLTIAGLNSNSDEYLNKYTSKELQTGEFDASLSTGLEMFDFGSRFYDPQLGVWFTPDPAEQFHNPYLGIGNNPVVYVDPDGEFIVPMLLGAGISVLTNGISNSINGQGFFENAGKAALIGGIGGAFSFGIGQAVMGMSGMGQLAAQTAAHGHLGGMMSGISGGDYGSGFLSGAMGSLAGAGTGAALKGVESKFLLGAATVGSGAISGGVGAEIAGGDFWDGARNGAISSGLNHAIHAGYFGKGLMMSSITGRFRHILGPDATSAGLTADAQWVHGVTGEIGTIKIFRGKDAGFHAITDNGWGVGLGLGVGVEISDFYYSGAVSEISINTFIGNRTEFNLNVAAYGASAGITATYAKFNRNDVYGLGGTLGIDALGFKIGGSLNYGETHNYPWYKLLD